MQPPKTSYSLLMFNANARGGADSRPRGAGWLTSWNSTTVPRVSPEAERMRYRTRLRVFEAQYPARRCPCLRFDKRLAALIAKLEVRTVCYSFPVRLFHSRQHAGLSRRTDRLRFGF